MSEIKSTVQKRKESIKRKQEYKTFKKAQYKERKETLKGDKYSIFQTKNIKDEDKTLIKKLYLLLKALLNMQLNYL